MKSTSYKRMEYKVCVYEKNTEQKRDVKLDKICIPKMQRIDSGLFKPTYALL